MNVRDYMKIDDAPVKPVGDTMPAISMVRSEPSKRGALDRREALEEAYCFLTAAVNDSDISNLPPSLTHAYGKLTTAFHDCMLCEDAVIG